MTGPLDGLVPRAWRQPPALVPMAPVRPAPVPTMPLQGFPARLHDAPPPQAEMHMVELLLQDAEYRSREEARKLRLQCHELQQELQQQQRISSPKSPQVLPLQRPPLFPSGAEAKQLELRQQRERLQQQLCDLLQQFSEMRGEQDILCKGESTSSRGDQQRIPASPFRLFPPPRPVARDADRAHQAAPRPFGTPQDNHIRRSSLGSKSAGGARRSLRPSVVQATPPKHDGQGFFPTKGMSRGTSEEGDRCTSRGSTVTGHRTADDEASSPDTKLSTALHPKALETAEPAQAADLDELLQLISSGSAAVQCCDAGLGPEQAPPVAEVLQASTVQALILSSNELGPGGIDVIAPALPTCHHLRHLDLSWNQLGAAGAFVLAAQLPKMQLRHLEISSNQLEAAGAKAFAVALAEDRHLLRLDISWNFMGDEGGIAIAQMLSTNRTLQYLNLAINDLTWPSAAALRQVVTGHPSLQDLDVAGNDIPEDQVPKV